MAIPASTIVSVTPSVLNPGGTGLNLAGMFLSKYALLPQGAPVSFAALPAVGDYFGTSSTEYAMAKVYFQGFDSSNIKPGLLWFSRYPFAATSAFLRGAAVTSLDAVKAITAGSLSVTIDGSAKSTTSLNLSGVATMSAAATAIASALSLSGGQTCTYSSQFNAFVITSGTTGATSTIAFPGTATAAATALGLTAATGAVISQGADAVTDPGAFMDALLVYTTNWASLATTWEPDLAGKQAFAQWVSASNGRYLYAAYDSDATILQTPASFTGFGNWLKTNSVSGVAAVYNDAATAAMICGMVASIDFTQREGRVSFMFKTNSQMSGATVSDLTAYTNMVANGYSAYCNFGVPQSANMLADGQISGSFLWIDSYVNALWLCASIQQAEVTLLQQVKSVPYNTKGYTMIAAAMQDPIDAALNFGTIRANVKPSASQAAQMNAAAGKTIDTVVGTRGWYAQVSPADAATRAARKSPPISLWYMDGESVQQLNISAVDVL